MKKPVHALVLTCLSIACLAQQPSLQTTSPPRFLTKFSGVFVDFSELNTSLKSGGFKEFNSIYHIEYGISRKRAAGRWGVSLAGIEINSHDNDEYSIDTSDFTFRNRTLKGWGFKTSWDYYVVDNHHWKIFIPLNLQFMKYRLSTFDNIPPGFTVGNPARINENSFSSWRPSVELGVNLEKGFGKGPAQLIIGVNAGYRLDWGDQDWKYNNEISIGFPKFKNQGFVLGVSFGFSATPRFRGPRQM